MIVNYIIQAVLLLSYLTVFLFQYHQIKHLRDKLTTLEKFQNIFDIDKFEKYIKFIEQEANLKLERAKTERIDKTIKASIDAISQQFPRETENQILELLQFTASVLIQFEPEKREIYLLKLPFNEVALRKIFLDHDTPRP